MSFILYGCKTEANTNIPLSPIIQSQLKFRIFKQSIVSFLSKNNIHLVKLNKKKIPPHLECILEKKYLQNKETTTGSFPSLHHI
ncbi:hypothetical protein Syun_018967 [Stephania yunnanensis]|uniref:Uncharacterized protein n=1 Tax=Stephania yunnanensis TaxID=152371 RepID=A0AAP0IUC7_9MAGN